jgi:glc operon protein GlcG
MTALRTKRTLTLAAARAIADAAEQLATRQKLNVVIAILDEGANLLFLARMDDAPIGSVAVAQKKARTSVVFKSPSSDFEAGLAAGTTALLTLDILPFAGGVPLVVDGHVIGAIGVSGATAAQDGEIAQAGAKVLADLAGK